MCFKKEYLCSKIEQSPYPSSSIIKLIKKQVAPVGQEPLVFLEPFKMHEW